VGGAGSLLYRITREWRDTVRPVPASGDPGPPVQDGFDDEDACSVRQIVLHCRHG
jgi:hypothetical protein